MSYFSYYAYNLLEEQRDMEKKCWNVTRDLKRLDAQDRMHKMETRLETPADSCMRRKSTGHQK